MLVVCSSVANRKHVIQTPTPTHSNLFETLERFHVSLTTTPTHTNTVICNQFDFCLKFASPQKKKLNIKKYLLVLEIGLKKSYPCVNPFNYTHTHTHVYPTTIAHNPIANKNL